MDNNRNGFVLLVMSVVIMTAPVLAMYGGDYEISWSTIDGGGGRSIGGDYALTCTIGQPDAGVMAGGSYILSGGFWPGSKWCFVDLPDLEEFTRDWLKTGPGLAGDLDNSQRVDLIDFNIIATHWLRLCPEKWPWW